jgi:hypothetical protein
MREANSPGTHGKARDHIVCCFAQMMLYAQRVSFDAVERPLKHSPDEDGRPRVPEQVVDADTGLTLAGTREYDSGLGRLARADSILAPQDPVQRGQRPGKSC